MVSIFRNVIFFFFVSFFFLFSTQANAACNGTSRGSWNTSTNTTYSNSANAKSDEQDYYEIIITQEGTLNISIEDTDSGNWDNLTATFFLNSNCSSPSNWNSSTTTRNETGSLIHNILVSPGTYITHIAGSSNDNTNYTFSGKFTPACSGTTGLCGHYYNSGTEILQRDDANIDFNWGNGSPDTIINADNFSIVWNGFLKINENATYTFNIQHDDDFKLVVNNTTLYDRTYRDWTQWYDSSSTTLIKGCYPITISMVEYYGGAIAKLRWRNTGSISSNITIPAANFVQSCTGADLSLNEYSPPLPESADINEDINFSVRAENLGTLDANNIQLLVTYNQDVNIISASQNNGSDFNCTTNSGLLSAGTPITCTMPNTFANGAVNKDFSFIVQATSFGQLVQTSVISSDTLDSNASNNILTSTSVVIRTFGYCEKNSLSNGFHVVDPFNDINKSVEIFCYNNKDYIALPNKNGFNNFVFNSNSLSSKDYYAQAEANSKSFDAIEINAYTMEVITDSSKKDPQNISNFNAMGSSFSNINLIGTPFAIDWDNSQISNCNTAALRKGYYGQAVKINTLNFTNAVCHIDKMKIKLLDDYRYLYYKENENDTGSEVLQPTCKIMAESVPGNWLDIADIKGHYWIKPNGGSRESSRTDITKASERPIVAFCWYQKNVGGTTNSWVWTFLLDLDGKRTISKNDLTDKKDSCSSLGLFPFVPNTEDTFERVRKFLVDNKSQWDGYTGTIQEKVGALYDTDYYLDNEKTQLIWPYGSFGLYFPYDGNHDKDGNSKTWKGTANSNTGWMSGSPMHNIPTITSDYPRKDNDSGNANRDYYSYGNYSSTDINDTLSDYRYEDTMGYKGWITVLHSKTKEWFISRTGAGDNFNNTSQYPYYEPNGNYTANAWLNFLFDDQGRVRHNDDLDAKYPYYDYMCMAADNYDFATQYRTSPGPYNVVSAFSNITTTDPLEEMDEKNALYTQIVNKPFSVKVLRLDDNDLTTLTNSEDSIILELVDGENINEDASTCASAPSLFSDDTTMGISFNNSSTVVSSYSFNRAAKESTFRIKYIDWGKMFLGSGMTCASVSNMSANLKGVPQCLNSTTNIKSLFATKNLDVSLCTDGQNRACDSNMYSANGVNGTIEPETYNHNYGCLACLLDVAASYACSRDKFAIRPDTYSMDANETNLIGGRDYKLDINATQFNNINSLASYYDQGIINSSDFIATITLDKNSSCPLPDDIQNLSLPFSFNTSGRAIDIPFSYDNIGDVNVTLTDKEWTGVDQDENNGKGYDDCIIDSDSNIPINGKVGCDINGTKQFVFSPKEFRNTVVLRDFNNTTFTYLSNDINMSAILNINITAILDDNTTATNYTNRCFAKDINTTVSLIREPLASEWLTNDRNATVRIMFFDTNTTNSELNATGSSTLSSSDGNFTNGIANITINFNFDRNTSIPDEPFHIARNDFNITVIDTSDTNGSDFNRTANDYNATFYFGRAYAPDQTFNGDNGNAQVYYEVYCVDCNRTSLNIAGGESVDSINWFQNTLHVNLDGNITLFESIENVRFGGANYANADNNSSTVLINQGNEQQLLRINTLPYIDRITYTPHHWLVFNPSNPNATTGDFMVEFTSRGSWGGEGSVDQTDDNNTGIFIHDQNITTNQIQKRMDW